MFSRYVVIISRTTAHTALSNPSLLSTNWSLDLDQVNVLQNYCTDSSLFSPTLAPANWSLDLVQVNVVQVCGHHLQNYSTHSSLYSPARSSQLTTRSSPGE
ncbi:hypothetical protein ElyMa_005947300 [Elysia marginata]|uniref:Uncharacterized protein n=1 Tax=Elysia marginata TaxID=1093978 RepID=A0AAV4GBD2_9GAST|nr:hypothetical protein ElyMa_005947300 [Elysia marginata]